MSAIQRNESFPKAAYWESEKPEEKPTDGPQSAPVKPFVLAEYVWLDAWQQPRSKTKGASHAPPLRDSRDSRPGQSSTTSRP